MFAEVLGFLALGASIVAVWVSLSCASYCKEIGEKIQGTATQIDEAARLLRQQEQREQQIDARLRQALQDKRPAVRGGFKPL